MIVTGIYLLIMWLCGWFMLGRIQTLKKKCKNGIGTISVIIPARNEEENLKNLLPSLLNQSLIPHEIIVVNDDSHDQTEKIALDFGVTVIKSNQLPVGWLGKPWACWNGANQASGSFFLFLDADIILEKDALARLYGEWKSREGLISVQPFHRMDSGSEKFSSLFNLVVMGAMQCFSVFFQKPAGAFGPCLLIDKNTYYKIAGHEGIKHQVLEHMEMGKRALASGVRVSCFSGYGAVLFRMYPDGIHSLISGWCKSFALGSAKTPLRPLLLAVAWITGGVSLAVQLPFLGIQEWNEAEVLTVFYLLYGLQIYYLMRKIGTFSFVQALLHPLHFLFFLGVYLWSFLLSAVKKEVKWKGREISVSEKGDT